MIPQTGHLFFFVGKIFAARCAEEFLIFIDAVLGIIEVHNLIHALAPVSPAAPGHFKSDDSHKPGAYGTAGLKVEFFEMIVFYGLLSMYQFQFSHA